VLASALALGFCEKNFSAGSIQLHYLEGPNNGLPLLLLHGMSRDLRSFSSLLPELSSQLHVFALDLRGHGSSTHLPRQYRIDQFAGDISQFIARVLPRGVAVFGHSLGGMLGMYAAAQEQSRISALIVGDSMISPDNLATSAYYSLFSQLHRLLVKQLSLEELACGIGNIHIRVPGFDETLAIGDLPGNGKQVLMEWARSAGQTDPDVLAMAIDHSAFAKWNPVEILGRIECPVLLLQGNPELDGLLSDEDVSLAKRLLPRSEHVRFALLGHGLFMQQPKPVLQAMIPFLKKHSA
jgi:pimeloyl-ACP methyl ester carboxylesterase